MSENSLDLSIVIPAYNEQARLPQSLKDIQSFFTKFNIQYEVVVSIEPSTDKTFELSQKAIEGDSRFKIQVNDIHLGKGYAVKLGMLRAQAPICIFMDADLSTPLSEVISFLSYFADHPETDVLIGSRDLDRSKVIKKQSLLRRNMGRSFNRFVQFFAIKGITDTQCGFKAFRAKAKNEIFSRQKTNGFAFDVELLLLAQHMNFKIDVLPVRWINSPLSKVRIWIDPLKMFLELLQMRLKVRRSMKAQPLSQEPPQPHKLAS